MPYKDKENAKKRRIELYYKNHEKKKEKGRKWYHANKEKSKQYYIKNRNKKLEHSKKYNLVSNYNITIEQYNEIFNSQHGRCAICGAHQSEFKKALYVDHDHKTNKVRSLLCYKCNTAIGFLDESEERCEKIKNYLHKYKSFLDRPEAKAKRWVVESIGE